MTINYKSILSKEDLEENLKKNTVIKFYSPTCPPCKLFDKELAKYTLPCEINLLAIDASKSVELRRMYNVNCVPQILFLDDNNNILEEHSGFMDIVAFETKVKKYFIK